MQEIGTWTTSTGSAAAVLEYDADVTYGSNGEKMPSWLTGALQGAATGAAAGAAAGPYGALIGAAAGATIGGVTASQAEKPPATSAPSKPQPASSGTKPATSAPSAAQANAALQQLAAMLPALMQLLAASGKAKEADFSDESAESATDGEWGPESFEGNWSVP